MVIASKKSTQMRNRPIRTPRVYQSPTHERHRDLVLQVRPRNTADARHNRELRAWYDYYVAQMEIDSSPTFSEIAAVLKTYSQELREKVSQATNEGEKRGEVRGIQHTVKRSIALLIRLGLLATDEARTLPKDRWGEQVLVAALRLVAKTFTSTSPRKPTRSETSAH